jgi:peptidoglycan/xylan/chitin deacetylase (PgdA/CDA1 family)
VAPLPQQNNIQTHLNKIFFFAAVAQWQSTCLVTTPPGKQGAEGSTPSCGFQQKKEQPPKPSPKNKTFFPNSFINNKQQTLNMKKHTIPAIILLTLLSGIFLLTSHLSPQTKGILSITFDDGYLTQYENAFPLMQKHNFKGSLYYTINTEAFPLKKMMSIENVIEMHNAGWEIGAHSVNHPKLDKLSPKELTYELEYPLEFFKKHEIEIKTIVYPYWRYNEEVIKKTKKLYIAGHAYKEREANPLNKKIDFYTLNSIGIENTNTPEEICKIIEKAKNEKEWLILSFHSIENEKTRRWDTLTKDFEEVLNCIKKLQIPVKTVKEVVHQLKKTQNQKTHN